jgi:hypothetical protein
MLSTLPRRVTSCCAHDRRGFHHRARLRRRVSGRRTTHCPRRRASVAALRRPCSRKLRAAA